MNGRPVWSVAACLLFIIGVTTIVDVVLYSMHFCPPLGAPMNDTHAIILGVVGIVIGMAGVIYTWNAGSGPRWYALSLVVVALPQCWLGGWLCRSRYAR